MTPANSGNRENVPIRKNRTQPPARRKASRTNAHIATADQTIQGSATKGALYSHPPAADSRAVAMNTPQRAVDTRKSRMS